MAVGIIALIAVEENSLVTWTFFTVSEVQPSPSAEPSAIPPRSLPKGITQKGVTPETSKLLTQLIKSRAEEKATKQKGEPEQGAAGAGDGKQPLPRKPGGKPGVKHKPQSHFSPREYHSVVFTHLVTVQSLFGQQVTPRRRCFVSV